jgi:formylglycine-generating enzyme required for sulfatase activity
LKKSEPGLPRAKESWFRNSQGITMLKIEPGMFVRKDSPGSEFVEQSVTLSQAYYLSDREITVLQFRQFVNDRDYPDSEKPQGWIGAQKNYSPGEGYPVQQVRWYDAVLYCNWLSKQNGRDPAYVRTGEKEKVAGEEWDTWELVPHGTGYRLPTEAEWEFGCRSGTTTFYSSGNQEVLSRKYGTWMPLSENQATLSGAKLPNGYGLFDMHGNVLEWCHDWHDDYGGQAVVDPIGAKSGSGRVSRGGCWSSGASNCRSAIRFWSTPDLRNSSLGFRVAAVPSSE